MDGTHRTWPKTRIKSFKVADSALTSPSQGDDQPLLPNLKHFEFFFVLIWKLTILTTDLQTCCRFAHRSTQLSRSANRHTPYRTVITNEWISANPAASQTASQDRGRRDAWAAAGRASRRAASRRRVGSLSTHAESSGASAAPRGAKTTCRVVLPAMCTPPSPGSDPLDASVLRKSYRVMRRSWLKLFRASWVLTRTMKINKWRTVSDGQGHSP